jgi:hypothetical protein
MSSTKVNGKKTFHKHRMSWLGAATAVALVAGTATLTTAAPRSGSRTEASRARMAATFNWQTFAPGRLVRVESPNGMSGSAGDLHTEGLQAPAMSFSWQVHTPGRLVHLGRPSGSTASGTGDTQADALRAPATFNWQAFTPGHIAHIQPASGAGASSGELHADAIRSSTFRPALVYGLGRDDAGGVRAAMGVSFRIR